MSAQAFALEIATSDARLAELAPAWTTLSRRADASLLQSHGWITAWWNAFPARSRPALRLVLAWQEGALVGMLPLVVRRFRGVRVLEWAAKDVTDYGDALVETGDGRDGIVRAMWAAISRDGGWDVAYLSHLAPGSAVGAMATAAGPSGVRLRPGRRTATSLRVAAPVGSDRTWFDALPKKPRQNYRRAHAALVEMGIAARFRLVEPHEPVDALLGRMIELKLAWLRRTGQVSPLFADGGALFRGLVDALAQAGALRVFVLEDADGRVLAGSVNFVEHERLFAFFTTYDPVYERASVGTLMLVDAIRWALDRGLREVDFLCGDEEYKRRLTERAVTLRSVVAARTLLGRAALAVEDMAHAVREGRARRVRDRGATAPVQASPQLARPRVVRAARAGPLRLPESP